MKTKNYKKQNGYVAFITVLIISALILSLLISLPLTTTDSLKSTLAMRKGVQTRELAHSCAELAIIQLQRDLSYAGETLSLEPGSCIISVADTSSGKSIDIEATVEEYVKTLIIEVETLGRSVNVTSWEIS